MKMLKDWLRIFTFLLIYLVIVAFIWSPRSHAHENYSFDVPSKLWKIDVTLQNGNKILKQPIEAIFVDYSTHEVIILYPGENRGVHYPCKDIKEIEFIKNDGHRMKHIINHHNIR